MPHAIGWDGCASCFGCRTCNEAEGGMSTVTTVQIPFLEHRDPPGRLHSGGESHWFVDANRIFYSRLRDVVLDYWIKEMELGIGKAHIIGIPRGGLWWAKALAVKLDLTWGGPDDVPYPSSLLWVVDDVVTTGTSIMAVPNAAHRMAVVDRGCGEQEADTYNPHVVCWARMPLP